MVYKIFRAAGRGLLPPYCVLCLNSSNAADDYFCSRCAAELPWIDRCCDICGLPLAATSGSHRCGRCLQILPRFDCCIGAFHYAEPIARLINDFKFSAKLHYGRVLGLQLAARLAHHYSQQPMPELLLPVPLHRARLRERGFNQSLELMKTVAGKLRIATSTCQLVRRRATASQKDLPLHDRVRNMRGAFALRSTARMPATVALIDDVVTSGRTVEELAGLLKNSGVKQVHVWCVARTDRSG